MGDPTTWKPDFFGFPVTTDFGAPTAGDPLRPHLAVDFAAPLGTAVQSGGVGTVSKVFDDQAAGHQVQVKYAQGGTGWFAHLNDILVNVGDAVTPATVLGHSGMSGSSVTGPHLHYQLLNESGASVDPLSEAFSKLVSATGSFASEVCPPGWESSSQDGIPFCFRIPGPGGGGSGSGSGAGSGSGSHGGSSGGSSGGGGSGGGGLGGPLNININWPHIPNVDWWRAGFLLLGAVAIVAGARMYLSNSDVREAVPSA